MVTRMLGQVYKAARNKASMREQEVPAFAQDSELQRQFLDLLAADADADQRTVVRDVHNRLGQSQPSVLRTIRHLEQAGRVEVETSLHDPLGSPIKLRKPSND